MTYTHDPNGNLERTSAGQTFTYDPFNRMIQAVSAGGTATYTYNGDGLKVQRVGPDGTTRYYHDGIRPIWETDGAGAMTTQLDRDIFGNLLSRREASGTRRYFHPDGLGSTVALSDEAGGVAASMLYDAWGNVRVNSGAGHGRYRFTGAELDEASGLYHMGARFYDPTIGRWLSEDPVQSAFEPLSLSFYAYVANNPLALIDPTGMMPTGPESGGCGGDLSCPNEAAPLPGSRTWAETVLEWYQELGPAIALDLVRQAWRALNEIIDALANVQYGDANLAASFYLGFMGGVIYAADGQVYAYAGATVGFAYGFSYTLSAQTVTPGLNIAFSGTIPGGLAFQIGTALECISSCNYLEVGISTPVPAATIAVFKVWAIRR